VKSLFYSGDGMLFPLYCYSETNGQPTIAINPSAPKEGNRKPNLNTEIVTEIAKKLGITFVPEKFPSYGGVSVGRGGRPTEQSTETQDGRNTKNYVSLPYNPNLKERAKQLRQAGNLSEVLFWNQLKNKQFRGFDFDRQKIVGNYIVDFYCSNYHTR
jgi:hypothetical protein